MFQISKKLASVLANSMLITDNDKKAIKVSYIKYSV